MKRFLLFALSSIPFLPAQAVAQVRVLVIESQSINSGHTMDTQWVAVATAAGYSVSMAGQAELAGTAFHATTDILIVASGVIPLPVAASSSIATFVAQGGNVYLQGEYQLTYDTNVLLATLANQYGGNFTWSAVVPGDLDPVTVSPPLDGPIPVPPLDYWWYGATGSGTGLTPVLHNSTGTPLGWVLDGAPGRLISATDQDWIHHNPGPEDLLLMQNMLTYLEAIPLGTNYCGPALPNSSGSSAEITALGAAMAGGLPLELAATNMPLNRFGMFLASRNQGFLNPPGSMGIICLSNPIARFNAPGQIRNSGTSGTFALDVDTNAIPLNPAVPVVAGETWNFQAWFRDMDPNPTSNFTDGVSILFL